MPRGARYIVPGSVVGVPSASISEPGATGLPALCATRTLPMAMRLVAKSSTKRAWRAVPGMAMQTGLVAKRPSRPPQGATGGSPEVPFTKWIEASPASASCSP